jgi:tetratricopeptide (TPR) repeat protein
MTAASSLLRRTVELLAEGSRERLELLPDLGESLVEIGDFEGAEICLDEALAGAQELGDTSLEAEAALTRLLVRHHTTDDLDALRAEVVGETDRWIPKLEEIGAPLPLAKAWRMVAFVHGSVCQWQETAHALERAIGYARSADDARQAARLSVSYVMALCEGPTPAPEAIARVEEVLALGLVDRQAEALTLFQLAPLHAMSADFSTARELVGRAGDLLRDLGETVLAARASDFASRVELMAGEPDAAEAMLRADYDTLTSMDERFFRPNIAALLARTLYELGRVDEAEQLAAVARGIADPEDVEAQAVLQSVQARILASRGEPAAARDIVEAVVSMIRDLDAPAFRADTLVDLADALAGFPAERAAVLDEARVLYSRKRHLVGLAQVEAQLAELARAQAI